MILYQNITNSEYYRLHGKLTPERIEELLEIEEASKTETEFESLYNAIRGKLYNLCSVLDHSILSEVREEIEDILNRS